MKSNSSNSNSNSEEDSSSAQETVEGLQQELLQIEQNLGNGNAYSSRTNSSNTNAGRAVFDSIGSALGSIRSRLQEHLLSTSTSSPSPSPSSPLPSPNNNTTRVGVAASSPSSVVGDFSERLLTAERAYQTRMPLPILQRELSRRTSESQQTSPNSSCSSLRKEDAGTMAEQKQRSALVPSRKRAEALEHNDIALHEASGGVFILEGTQPIAEQDEETEGEESEQSQEVDVLLPTSASSPSLSVLLKRESSATMVVTAPHKYSWGTEEVDYNLFGTEEPSTQNRPHTIPVDSRIGRANLVSLALGHTHAACATATGGLLICGNNSEGAVDPSQRTVATFKRPMHLESLALTRILQVSCGLDHTAALTETRSVLTWGNDQDGQLGQRRAPSDDSRRFRSPAAMVLGTNKRASKVACGHRFTLVLTTRMEVLVCGREEISGYSPEDNRPPQLPMQNSSLQGLPLVSIAAGHTHAVVVTAHGTAYAWGSNPNGACGRIFPKSLSVPVPIHVPTQLESTSSNSQQIFPNWSHWENSTNTTLSCAKDVMVLHATCGGDHTVLVTHTGQLLVAGNNQHGQLGLPQTTESVAPAQIVQHPLGQKFSLAEAGTKHTLVLDDQGNVWFMGNDQPLAQVMREKSIQTIAAGGSQNVAIATCIQETNNNNNNNSNNNNSKPTMTTKGLEGLLNGLLLEEKASESSAAQELASQTEELFKCPAVMNSLFLDPNEMNELYHKLIQAGGGAIQQQVAKAMETGILKGLEIIRTARLMYPESVRCLLLYLQCPLFWMNDNDNDQKKQVVSFDVRGELIMALCETISGLSFEGYKALLAWATSSYSSQFVPYLVKPLVVQLNQRLETGRTRAIPVIVGVLRWFQNAAERSENEIAKPQDFYSSGIGELSMETLYEDLRGFKRASKSQRSANFFICNNVFLLSPGAKRNLLQVENQITMVQAAQAGGVSYDAARREFLFQPYFVLPVDRQYMLQQTLQAVSAASPGELRKSLKIVFKGEDGVDAGGVTKEFFQLLVAQLFDVNTGMWTMHDGTHTWFNSDCIWNYDGYYLVGVLLGLAVYNGVILDVHFPNTVYRKLLGLPLGLEDMVDEQVRNGLQNLLDYEGDDVEDIFCMTFEVTWMDLGAERRRELKPGGANIPVTNDNREEYVMLYVKWLLVVSIQPQYNEFERGFMQVMENSSLDLLRPEELELLVVGTPELDFNALEENAQYEGYTKDSAVVRNLWKFVQNSERDTQLNFLKFATGSPKAPIGGLGALPFKIQRAGPDSMQLPTSHTCFNTLLVPDYGDNYDKLAERLGRAVIECEGFGLQ